LTGGIIAMPTRRLLTLLVLIVGIAILFGVMLAVKETSPQKDKEVDKWVNG
jgi:hypothetical protein